MKCKKCGAENSDAKRTCGTCGAFLEGYTLNNVTGEYGYRGADGNFYKSEEEYYARCSAAAQSPIDHAKLQVELQVHEIMAKTMSEKLHPLVDQMTKLLGEAFETGFNAGLSCGKYVNYNKE